MHKWAMFTDAGDARVQQIVEQAIDRAGTCSDDDLWRWCYASLEMLSAEEDHREATDTEVRETVFRFLVDEQLINHETTDYWFYVNWYGEDSNRRRFAEFLEEFDGRSTTGSMATH